MTNYETKLNIMLFLQEELNTKVNSQWRDANNNWMLAASIETAEMIEHYGWKWWKKQTPNMDQVCLELVDIWHFILSYSLQHDFDIELTEREEEDDFIALSSVFTNQVSYLAFNAKKKSEFEEVPDKYIFSQATMTFFSLLKAVNFSFDDLYQYYVMKNTLNIFRQNNGYKEGTYVKIWADGKEDNEVLLEVAEEVDPDDERYFDVLYELLKTHYSLDTGITAI